MWLKMGEPQTNSARGAYGADVNTIGQLAR